MKTMDKKIINSLSVLFLFSFLWVACQPKAPNSVANLLSEQSNLSTLAQAVQTSDLLNTLDEEGPYTVFAPSDEVFANYTGYTVDQLLLEENREILNKILKYHTITGRIMSSDLKDGQATATVQGEKVIIQTEDGIKVNDAHITTADLEADNGVIHIIDKVLLPLSMQEKTIAQLAIADDRLSTLVEALKADNLVKTLQSKGPFTVFAPTNEAFAALPEGTVESLLEPENKEILASLLSYHVVTNSLMAEDLTTGTNLISVQGEPLKIAITEQNTAVAGATVISPNIKASNGVVHVVNTVMIPPSMSKEVQ
jgi:uncharacterized surface protein with fasciclin (FAS1) repeats